MAKRKSSPPPAPVVTPDTTESRKRDPSLHYLIGELDGEGQLLKPLLRVKTIGQARKRLEDVASISGKPLDALGVWRVSRVVSLGEGRKRKDGDK